MVAAAVIAIAVGRHRVVMVMVMFIDIDVHVSVSAVDMDIAVHPDVAVDIDIPVDVAVGIVMTIVIDRGASRASCMPVGKPIPRQECVHRHCNQGRQGWPYWSEIGCIVSVWAASFIAPGIWGARFQPGEWHGHPGGKCEGRGLKCWL